MNRNEGSYLWHSITESAEFTGWDLSDFRKPGKLNSRLAAWEPRELTTRYYRSFLNLAFLSAPEWVKQELSSFSLNTSLGAPVENQVEFDGTSFAINLDYLQTFEEMYFLNASLDILQEVKSVCEVGAGFGRLAHVMLERFPIESYFIVDLPPVLELSKRYLARVLPHDLFSKVKFISSEDERNYPFSADLSIQIDGLQEMTEDAITTYMSLFSSSRYCFQRNVVAKYLPVHAGIESSETRVPLELGRSRKIVDIWNTVDLVDLYPEHLQAYTPFDHRVLTSQPFRIFPHYLLSLSTRVNQ